MTLLNWNKNFVFKISLLKFKLNLRISKITKNGEEITQKNQTSYFVTKINDKKVVVFSRKCHMDSPMSYIIRFFLFVNYDLYNIFVSFTKLTNEYKKVPKYGKYKTTFKDQSPCSKYNIQCIL